MVNKAEKVFLKSTLSSDITSLTGNEKDNLFFLLMEKIRKIEEVVLKK